MEREELERLKQVRKEKNQVVDKEIEALEAQRAKQNEVRKQRMMARLAARQAEEKRKEEEALSASLQDDFVEINDDRDGKDDVSYEHVAVDIHKIDSVEDGYMQLKDQTQNDIDRLSLRLMDSTANLPPSEAKYDVVFV